MAGKSWTTEELEYLKEFGPKITCEEIAEKIGRTTRSVRHKFNKLGLKKERADIGDIINGWKIIDIYEENIGSQNINMARVVSTLDDTTIKEYRLTLLTNNKVGWPDRRRPDVTDKNTTHGLSQHPLYKVYKGIKNRCYNKKQLSYKNYGAKGITMCQEWKEDFTTFYNWALENNWKQGLQIDREKNSEGYNPDNCRIVTRKVNNDNRSISQNITAFGETKNASDWSLDDRCKCSYTSLLYRIENGWNTEKAITKPTKNKQNFKRYKGLYKFIKNNYSEILQEFLDQEEK